MCEEEEGGQTAGVDRLQMWLLDKLKARGVFVSVCMCASVGVFMLLAGPDSVWAFHEMQKMEWHSCWEIAERADEGSFERTFLPCLWNAQLNWIYNFLCLFSVSFFHVHKKSCSFCPPKVQTDWFSKSTHMQQCSHIACHCPVFIHSYCALCCQTAVSLYSCWPSDSASVLYS